jgi:hypothetical protein
MICSRRRTSGLAALVAASVLLLGGDAGAQDAQASSGRHRHENLFIRVIAGPSFQTAVTSEEGEDLTVSGPGITLQAAFGWNVARNLILYAELFDDVALSTTVDLGDQSEELDDTSFGVFGAGLGVAYYTAGNFYVSGSAALSQLHATYEEDGVTVKWDSSFGFGVNVLAGKEWWISDSFALGAALHLLLGSVPDEEADESWGVGGVGLALSATSD